MVDTLNKGLRPHLTLWQAKFNKWYKSELEKEENKAVAPQVIQRNFPEYNVLMSDLLLINGQLVEYTNELKKIVKLENK